MPMLDMKMPMFTDMKIELLYLFTLLTLMILPGILAPFRSCAAFAKWPKKKEDSIAYYTIN